jgi:large subunit ribosomal protein L25
MALELVAQPRTQFGREVKQLRVKGLVPGELYGFGIKNEHVSVTMKEFMKLYKKAGESTLVDLMIDGKKHPVLINDVQFNPITDEIESIDFYQVRLDQKIRLKVPVNFVGEAPAVKEKGGILVKALSEIEVEALPTDIPHQLEVNLKTLTDIGTSFAVSQLVVPAGVRILVDPTFVIMTVTARMTEEQEAALSAAADVSTIKTEGEEKKEKAAEAAPAEEGAAPAASAAKPAAK